MTGDNQKNVTDPVADLLARAGLKPGRPPPPVERWNPPHCGAIDMRIARDGTWFYLGTPIGRLPLVRLFASILRRDAEGYVLVTPVEKVLIRVDDAPFLAVDFERRGTGRGQEVTFITSLGDDATAGNSNPIRVTRDPASGEPAPYVLIRRGLEALIDRKSFYRLAEIAVHEVHEGSRWFGLWSGGVFFPFIPSAELPDAAAG